MVAQQARANGCRQSAQALLRTNSWAVSSRDHKWAHCGVGRRHSTRSAVNMKQRAHHVHMMLRPTSDIELRQ